MFPLTPSDPVTPLYSIICGFEKINPATSISTIGLLLFIVGTDDMMLDPGAAISTLTNP